MSGTAPRHKNLPPRHILLADDFSRASDRALAYAKAIASRFESELSLFHVSAPCEADEFEDETSKIVTDARLGDIAAQLSEAGVVADVIMQSGRFSERILEVMSKGDFDLIIMGTDAPCGLERELLGSSAGDLFAQTTLPMMVVGPRTKTLQNGLWCPKLITHITTTPQTEEAKSYAESLAAACDAKLSSAALTTVNENVPMDMEATSVAPKMPVTDVLVVPISHKELWSACSNAFQQLVRTAECPVIAVPCKEHGRYPGGGGTWT